MIIIETNYKCFDDYINTLSKPAKKNYSYVKKHNQDLDYQPIFFNQDEIKQFMALWEQQLVFGKSIQWAFPFTYIEHLANSGKLLCFRAQLNGVTLATHFIQKRHGYFECHAPLYEKNMANEKRYLAKYMWFSLIQYCIENQIGLLDMGGGIDIWHENIRRRSEFPHLNYKWTYVPEYTKEHPEKEKPYMLKTYGAEKILDYDCRRLLLNKELSLLMHTLRLRWQRLSLDAYVDNFDQINSYQGDPVKWTDSAIHDFFLSAGIYHDGWTEKRFVLKWKNQHMNTLHLLVEFPDWCGHKKTILKGTLNNKKVIQMKLKPGQTRLTISSLQKMAFNKLTFTLSNEFSMPAPDLRHCYLRLIQMG